MESKTNKKRKILPIAGFDDPKAVINTLKEASLFPCGYVFFC
jgi:hypothetical protein